MRRLTRRLLLTCPLIFAAASVQAAGPQVILEATLDAAQEVPAPTGALPGAGGTATFEYDETSKTITYKVTVQNLTGPPILAHIHQGATGQAGPVSITLDQNHLADSTDALPVPPDLVATLFAGGTYVNVHTAQNPDGEIRGQIHLKAATCACDGSAATFRQCVKDAINALPKAERRSSLSHAVKRDVKKSSCGRTSGPKKAVACCVSQPAGNIVTDVLCLPVRAAACSALGGTSLGTGTSCFPSSPCTASVLTSVTTTTTQHRTTTTMGGTACVHAGGGCSKNSACCSQYCYLGQCY
jgi:hypothetical protein